MHYKRTCILWKWHPLLRCTFQDGHSASHLVWPLEVGTLVVFGWVVTSTPGSSDMDLKRDWQLIGKGAAGCQSCGFSSPLSLPGEAEVTGQQRLSQHRCLRRYTLKRWLFTRHGWEPGFPAPEMHPNAHPWDLWHIPFGVFKKSSFYMLAHYEGTFSIPTLLRPQTPSTIDGIHGVGHHIHFFL